MNERGESDVSQFESEKERTPEERVSEFINTLYLQLPENPEVAASGKHLVEISEMQIGEMKPPLETEGRIAILPGQVIALTGHNGAGKSTFFKSFLKKENLPDGLKYKPGLKIGYLPQEGDFSLVKDLSLQEFLDEMNSQIREANEWEFDDNLFAKGESILFKDALNTKVGNLSGGEKTKLQMFVLLLRKAELIFLDEPTNHIDQEGQALLTSIIQKLKAGEAAGNPTSFVISSHNEEFLKQNSQNGALSISQTEGNRKIKQERIYKSEGVEKPKYRIPWLSKASFTGEIYPSGYEQINNSRMYISSIQSGAKIILAGENGSGKSTFLKLLANPESRKVASGSNPVYLPQEWPKEIQEGTLSDFLGSLGVDELNFDRSLSESGFLERRPKDAKWLMEKFSSFSAGEQRFLWFLAVSSGKNSSFLLLDEPTNHLDSQLKAELIKAILEFPGAVLTVTHDKDLMQSLLSKAPWDKKEFWLMEKSKDVNYDSTGMDTYFGSMQRKAEQSVRALTS